MYATKYLKHTRWLCISQITFSVCHISNQHCMYIVLHIMIFLNLLINYSRLISRPNAPVVAQLTATYNLFLQLTRREKYAERHINQLTNPASDSPFPSCKLIEQCEKFQGCLLEKLKLSICYLALPKVYKSFVSANSCHAS